MRIFLKFVFVIIWTVIMTTLLYYFDYKRLPTLYYNIKSWLRDMNSNHSFHLELTTVSDRGVWNNEWLRKYLQNAQEESESDCSAPFLTVGDGGRLGNIICQFITAYTFKMKYGIRVAILSERRRKTLKRLFGSLPSPTLPNPCFNGSKKGFLKLKYYDMDQLFSLRKNMTSNQLIENPYHYHITGYPCPLLPDFIKYRAQILKILPFRQDLILKAKKKIQISLESLRLSMSKVELVSVHVRRIDYIKYGESYNLTHPMRNYYIKAFNFFRKRCKAPVFVVISDEHSWPKKHLNFPDVIFPGDGDILHPVTDFAIIVSCDHHIYGVGTYGKTSAYLGYGSIIRFKTKTLPYSHEERFSAFQLF
ncbi:Galactoside 2-alpha-L-fucosyltransferase 2 [Armadillidium vulgare]|nr:Galactoside 2-alpha-L-fucosyltransferase 2 [Armadillidium vulgare]